MVVVITGASSGIGRALAEYLSARKARLTLTARRLDRLEALNADPDVFNSTLLIIDYDENDGQFDHVPPPVPANAAAVNATRR